MKRGIDVSTFQGAIDWEKVCDSGIDFAMIKATQGRSETQSYRDFTDIKFTANITGASSVGIRCGVYHYLTAQTVAEALDEAEYYLSVIAPYKSNISLYAAVDVESKHLPNDKQLLTQIVCAFCARVESEGYDPIIYTNLDWMCNRLNDISAYPLWLALWRNKNNVPSVDKYPNLRIWQWGGEVVSGINGKVDANYMIAEKRSTKNEKPKVENDASECTSSWAEDAVEWAKENKILLGDGNGKYRPHDSLTREEACLIAKRTYDKIIDCAAAEVAKRMLAALKLKID